MDEAIRNAPRFYGNIGAMWKCNRCGKEVTSRELRMFEDKYYWYVDARHSYNGVKVMATPVCGCGKTLDYEITI